jgi:CysZ protein
MLSAAVRAFAQIFSPPFRAVLLKSVALTLVMLAAVWAVLYGSITHLLAAPWPGVETLVDILTGIGLFIGLGFLIAPVTALFAGLFLDDVAEEVERIHYPFDPPGREMPFGPALLSALRFTGLVVIVNALVLLLVLLPGINMLAFFFANAWLLGREYFEQVASRFHGPETIRALRAEYGGRIFLAGLMIAVVLAVPIVNVLTPLFATAFMVHVFKSADARSRTRYP